MSGIEPKRDMRIRDFRAHPRDWRGFAYAYPVLSRRAKGLSLGVNLNPDTACNYDCIYCQVDRTMKPRVRRVDLARLRTELDALLTSAVSGSIFGEPEFSSTPDHLRRLNDIAFSGDGEPTTCPVFADAVALADELKRAHGAEQIKLILITDACYLRRPEVMRGLEIMDRSNGEIWAKLDAGTEAYHRLVNRPNETLAHVIENITHAARRRPVVIQSLFMLVDGHPPDDQELAAYTDRLREIMDAGGAISLVQVYTVARRPVQSIVTPLSGEEVDAIAELIRDRTNLPAESYYG